MIRIALIFALLFAPLAIAAETGTANQVLRYPSSAPAGTRPKYGAVNVASSAAVTGSLVVANGGTGLIAGTSGGVPYFSSTSAMASSALLTQYQLLIGGGAGASPYSLGSLGTAGQFLKSAGAGANPAWTSFTAPTHQTFTSGTGTYTPTASNILYLHVRLIGGGGGGGGSGSSAPGTGGTGGTTYLGSTVISADGGVGGQAESAGGATTTFTLSGTGVSGFTIQGVPGQSGGINNTTNYHNTVQGGIGGSTAFGGGAGSIRGSSANSARANTGAGGGGGNGYDTTTWQSGAGGSAGLYIDAYVTGAQLATWIATPPTYQVGAGGTAGAAGGGGGAVAGGVGGSGIVTIDEFYQ